MSEERPVRRGPDDPERRPGVPPHQAPPETAREREDEEVEESFPSSDPPATGAPGI